MLKSPETRPKIDEVVERVVTAPNAISKLVESVFGSEDFIRSMAVDIKNGVENELVKDDVTNNHKICMTKSLNRFVPTAIFSHRGLENCPSLEGSYTRAKR